MREKPVRTTSVISLWDSPAFDQNLPTGTFKMPACPPCEKHSKAPCRPCGTYSVLVVGKRAEAVDIGDDKRRIEIVDDLDLAHDLAAGVPHYGVLAIEGSTPTPAELDEAFDALEKYLTATLENEDQVWSVSGKHYNVEHAIKAAKYFGVERAWMSDTRPKVPCEACGVHNLNNTVRCQCGAILDWPRARDLGLLSERQEEIGVANGRLKAIPTKRAPQQAQL